MAFRQALLNAGETFDGYALLQEAESFEKWLNFELRLKGKYGDGYVPSEVFLAIRNADDRLVGIIDYRHPLSPFLLKYGGNIGYTVAPSLCRRGYAKEMLTLMLDVCRRYGEKRVLLCCDKLNKASSRTIIACGGILENETDDDAGLAESGIIQRYWIKL